MRIPSFLCKPPARSLHRVWRLPLLALVLATWTACGSGGGHSGGPNPPPAVNPPPPPSPPPPGPRAEADPGSCECGLAPLTPAFLAQYGTDPVNKAILDAYQRQVRVLLDAHSPFGQSFVSVAADPAAGAAEGYFALSHNGMSMDFTDPIERPLVRAHGAYGQSLAADFEPMYRTQREWNIPATRRVSGFLFHGAKAGPAQLQASCALYSPLFRASTLHPEQRVFQVLMAGGASDKSRLRWAFDLPAYTTSTRDKGFCSFTRSVHIARSFAVHFGSMSGNADSGYVYVAYVRDGLDAADARVLHTSFSHEQEVASPGAVPFTWVVAYRKFEKHPDGAAGNAPPEFTGPVMVRDHLAALEPAAYREILRALSQKSRYTVRFESGRSWRAKERESHTLRYQTAFKLAHPRLDPALIWGGP